MPRLPDSGAHVASDPAPLRTLLKGAGSGFNAHHIMSIERVEDVLAWLDMLVLDPDDPSSSAPVGRLAEWESYADAHGWSAADRTAMREFIRFKVLPAMAQVMVTVREGQAALLASREPAGALARMWRAGVHPLQVEPE
jgi:hypothetical protein